MINSARPAGWRACAVALLAVLLIVLPASVARADGDPGSDVLVYQNLFFGTDAGLSVQQQAELGAMLRAAAGAGFPVRVAIIASPFDLGAVTGLWRQPRTYARFLGYELSLAYKQRLLVVMPNGLRIQLARPLAGVRVPGPGRHLNPTGRGRTVQRPRRRLSASWLTPAGVKLPSVTQSAAGPRRRPHRPVPTVSLKQRSGPPTRCSASSHWPWWRPPPSRSRSGGPPAAGAGLHRDSQSRV